MAQYIEGSVAVTNGSAVVTGTGTEWLANASGGDFFQVSGEAASLIIQTVDSDTQITLSTNFAGVTGSALNYAIHRDFSATGFPLLKEGDVFFSQVYARFIIQLEAILAGTINVTGTFPQWLTLASGPPGAGVGNDGDLALIENGDVYSKSGGVWSLFTNLAFDIPSLTAVTTIAGTDELVAQTSGGPRRITRDDALPKINNLPTLTADDVILGNDFVWIWDGTDNAPKQISIRELIFGNYRNERYANLGAALTLAVGTDNVRIIECDGTWTDPRVIVDGGAANIDGAFFTIVNSTLADLTLEPTGGITLLVDGVASASGTIREGRIAGVSVNNAGNQAVFTGG